MLIKKGVSIPAVARLMRHKDGGGLLLKKYTQGFEEEIKGITIRFMNKYALTTALGSACLSYGQAGHFAALSSAGKQARFFPSGEYVQSENGVYDTLLITADGKIDGDLGLDNSVDYQMLAETYVYGQQFFECAIDTSGKIHINQPFTSDIASRYQVIDDENYTNAKLVCVADFSNESGRAWVSGLTSDGRIKSHILGELGCIPEDPEGDGWIDYSILIEENADGQSEFGAMGAIDADGFLHTWITCNDRPATNFLNPPSFPNFIQVKICLIRNSSCSDQAGCLVGIGLQENGDVYIWGSEYGSGYLLQTGMKSIYRDPYSGCDVAVSGIRIDNTPDWNLLEESDGITPEDIDVIDLHLDCGSPKAIIPPSTTTYQATPETIQQVIANCKDFDIVQISSGQYDFGEPDSPEQGKSFVIQGVGNTSEIRILPNWSFGQYSYCTIRDCTVVLKPTGYYYGGTRFENCRILREDSDTPYLLYGDFDEFYNCDLSEVDLTEPNALGSLHLHIESSSISGIHLDTLCASLVDCAFEKMDYNAPFQGAITVDKQRMISLDLEGTEIQGNQAVRGAGVCIYGTDENQIPNASIIRNGSFEGNRSVFGGAIYSQAALLTVQNSTFVGNFSPNGGSIYFTAPTGTKQNVSSCNFAAAPESSSEIVAVHTDTYISECFFSGSPTNGYEKIWNASKSVFLPKDNVFCGNIQSFAGLSVFDLGGNAFNESCDQTDCNRNGQIDSEEIDSGLEVDCDLSGILDSCELAGDPSLDCDGNGTLDSCDIENGTLDDCNQNQIGDACEIAANPGLDSNSDGIIDACQCITDINLDGVTDFTDIVQLLSCWQEDADGVCTFADVNKDEAIDFGDLILVLSGFGPC